MDSSRRISELLSQDPYDYTVKDKDTFLLELLKERVLTAAGLSDTYGNYVKHWPVKPDTANNLYELPFLPVSIFKRNPPLALVPDDTIQRIMTSSATTGQEPSRIALDRETAARMSRGIMSILKDYIGTERRPYIVVDSKVTNPNSENLGARAAAIRGLAPFANEITYCMRYDDNGSLELDRDALLEFAGKHGDKPVLVYGFTTILWFDFIQAVRKLDISINLPHAHVLHSGGWKKLINMSVTKKEFISQAADIFGCPGENIIDFYGMVENLGVIYPDCSEGNKHAPVFGEVIIRNPLALKPVMEGETGILQVCSILPGSFPGHLLITEDLAMVIHYDNCPCGRPGIAFRFQGRIPKSEVRGCGNVTALRTNVELNISND